MGMKIRRMDLSVQLGDGENALDVRVLIGDAYNLIPREQKWYVFVADIYKHGEMELIASARMSAQGSIEGFTSSELAGQTLGDICGRIIDSIEFKLDSTGCRRIEF